MSNRRSSTIVKSAKTSSFQVNQSSSPINIFKNNDRQIASVKDFFQSCPYQTEGIDRNSIIKHEDTMSCLKRISKRNDVSGVIVTTIDGQILYECDELKSWMPSLASLCSFARHLILNHDPHDHIQAFRLRTKSYEIIITFHNEQLLIVKRITLNNNKTEIDKDANNPEEDLDTFLKRIQQYKMEKINSI